MMHLVIFHKISLTWIIIIILGETFDKGARILGINDGSN